MSALSQELAAVNQQTTVVETTIQQPVGVATVKLLSTNPARWGAVITAINGNTDPAVVSTNPNNITAGYGIGMYTGVQWSGGGAGLTTNGLSLLELNVRQHGGLAQTALWGGLGNSGSGTVIVAWTVLEVLAVI